MAVLCACPPKIDSPYFDKSHLSVANWNIINAQAIAKLNKPSYRIAVIADSHANYQPLLDAVMSINATPDIDFVVHLGDFTEKSLPMEFSYFMEIYGQLKIPSLVVIGNHDAIDFGPKMFEQMFGPRNFAVDLSWLQLILLDANTLETGPIDYPWLEQQLAQGPEKYNRRLIFRHTNYDNHIHHTQEDSDKFLELVEKYQVDMVLNGHRHTAGTIHYPRWISHQVSRVEGEAFSLIEVSEKDLVILNCKKGVCANAEAQTPAS